MPNRIFLALGLMFFTGCVGMKVSQKTQESKGLNQIEEILMGSLQEDVKKALGEPYQVVKDEASGDTVFIYTKDAGHGLLPWAHFVFGKDLKLKLKYVEIYSWDKESKIENWNKKLQPKELTLKSKIICTGHSVTYRNFIEMDPSTRLEVENNRVVQISWSAEAAKDEKSCP